MSADKTPVAATDPTVAPSLHRLAGMALRNGVLVIGPTYWAAAVRTDDGQIHTASRKRPTVSSRVDRIPALRGPVKLTEMMLVLPALRRALPQARLSFESRGVLGSTVLGSAASKLLARRLGTGLVAELASSATSLAVLLGVLKGGEIAQYHGAEHKVIGGYEQGIPAAEASKEHERCGTHLAVPMLVANAAAIQGVRLLFPNLAIARLLGIGAGIAASTELARAMQRGGDTPLKRLVARVGTGLQSVASTSEPNEQQLEVAEAALAELLRVEPAAAA